MNKIYAGFVTFLITVPLTGPAAAWSHANRWGGQ